MVSGLTPSQAIGAALFPKSWIHFDPGGPLPNDAASSENPMLVLISGILLLGAIGAFISLGPQPTLTHRLKINRARPQA